MWLLSPSRASVLLTHCWDHCLCQSAYRQDTLHLHQRFYHCGRMPEPHEHFKPEILSSSKKVPSSYHHQCSTHRATLLPTSAFSLLDTQSAFRHPSPTASAETLHGTSSPHHGVNIFISNKVNGCRHSQTWGMSKPACSSWSSLPAQPMAQQWQVVPILPANHLQESKLNASRHGKPK